MICPLCHRVRGPPRWSIIAPVLFLSSSFVNTVPLSTTFTTVGQSRQIFHDQTPCHLTKRAIFKVAEATEPSKCAGAEASASTPHIQAANAISQALAPLSIPAGRTGSNLKASEESGRITPESADDDGFIEFEIRNGERINQKSADTIPEGGRGENARNRLAGSEKDGERLSLSPSHQPPLSLN